MSWLRDVPTCSTYLPTSGAPRKGQVARVLQRNWHEDARRASGARVTTPVTRASWTLWFAQVRVLRSASDEAPHSGVSPDLPAIGARLQVPQTGCSVVGDLTQPEADQHEVRAMTIRTESRITIASRVEAVWAYVCDVGRWPEWAPTVLECRVRGGAALQPGSPLPGSLRERFREDLMRR